MNTVSLLEKEKDDFIISTDKTKINIPLVHQYLTKESYWAKNIPFDIVKRSVEGSVCFALYSKEDLSQVGFARVITDCATFGYLADVFVLPSFQGRGLGKWMMDEIINHPGLQGFRRWLLATKDAHGLYTRYGFEPLPNPERYMRRTIFEFYPENS